MVTVAWYAIVKVMTLVKFSASRHSVTKVFVRIRSNSALFISKYYSYVR